MYKVLMGKRPLGRSRRRWRMRSKWILERLAGGGGGVDSVGYEYEPVADSWEHCDEPSGSGTTEIVYYTILDPYIITQHKYVRRSEINTDVNIKFSKTALVTSKHKIIYTDHVSSNELECVHTFAFLWTNICAKLKGQIYTSDTNLVKHCVQ
jgi:hypothetical protein